MEIIPLFFLYFIPLIHIYCALSKLNETKSLTESV